MTHHSVMSHHYTSKNLKTDKCGDFSCDIDYSVGQKYLEMLSPLKLINVSPGAQRAPLADTKYPPAAQRKQAKRACQG